MNYRLLPVALLLVNIAYANTNPVELSATQCETPSPRLTALGDRYYDLDAVAGRPESDHENLTQLYQHLEGRWEGEQFESNCRGTGDSTRIRTRHFLLKNARAEVLEKGIFTIRSDKSETSDRRNPRNNSIRSISPDRRMDFYPASELLSLRVVDESTVIMNKRYRQSNGTTLSSGMRRGSTLRERQDEMTLSGDTLTIKTDWYLNGYFTGTETVHLTRRR